MEKWFVRCSTEGQIKAVWEWLTTEGEAVGWPKSGLLNSLNLLEQYPEVYFWVDDKKIVIYSWRVPETRSEMILEYIPVNTFKVKPGKIIPSIVEFQGKKYNAAKLEAALAACEVKE